MPPTAATRRWNGLPCKLASKQLQQPASCTLCSNHSAPSTILVSGESAGAVSCFWRSDTKAAHTLALGARRAAGACSTDPRA